MGAAQEFDDEVDRLRRRRLLAGALAVTVAAIIIAATVTADEGLIRLEGDVRTIEGYSGGVAVSWGGASYSSEAGEFVVHELTVQPMKRSGAFPADRVLHVVLVDASSRVLGETTAAVDGRKPVTIRLPRAVSVRTLDRVHIMLERDAS